MTNLFLEPPFGGLRGNLRISSIARWKVRGQLPIRDNWTFFASCYGWDVISRYWSKSVLFRGGGSLCAQILFGRGRRPTTVVGIRKLECFTVSQWRPNDLIFFRLDRVPSCDGWIDGRTFRRTELPWLIQHSALQAMRPRCKKTVFFIIYFFALLALSMNYTAECMCFSNMFFFLLIC